MRDPLDIALDSYFKREAEVEAIINNALDSVYDDFVSLKRDYQNSKLNGIYAWKQFIYDTEMADLETKKYEAVESIAEVFIERAEKIRKDFEYNLKQNDMAIIELVCCVFEYLDCMEQEYDRNMAKGA